MEVEDERGLLTVAISRWQVQQNGPLHPAGGMVSVESPGFASPSHGAEGRELGLAGGRVAADPHPAKSGSSAAARSGDYGARRP